MKSFLKFFDVVLHWEPKARLWVAETVGDRWYVAQGHTPDEALETLRKGLDASARAKSARGFIPFAGDRGLPAPERTQTRWYRATAFPEPHAARRGSAYRTSVACSYSVR